MGFLKSLFGLGDETQNLANLARECYPPPNANEAQYQKEALDELNSGTLPTGYSLKGCLCKKGEKLIYSFNEVTHYCSAVHWDGLAAARELQFASLKAFGFAPELIAVITFSERPWTDKAEDAWSLPIKR